MCFPIFSHGEKWGKKYMEREGNEYFSLSFHMLFFPFFSMGKNGKTQLLYKPPLANKMQKNNVKTRV